NVTNVQRLPNGNTFIATLNCLLEVDRAGREVYAVRHPNNFLSARKAPDGTIWALSGDNRFLLRLDTTGKELKNIQLNEAAGSTGGLDVLPNGGGLVPLMSSNRVIEIDADGKTTWMGEAPQPVAATHLPNGNVLVASYNTQRVYEIDRKGK